MSDMPKPFNLWRNDAVLNNSPVEHISSRGSMTEEQSLAVAVIELAFWDALHAARRMDFNDDFMCFAQPECPSNIYAWLTYISAEPHVLYQTLRKRIIEATGQTRVMRRRRRADFIYG